MYTTDHLYALEKQRQRLQRDQRRYEGFLKDIRAELAANAAAQDALALARKPATPVLSIPQIIAALKEHV